jgi:hypothetical protein
VKILLVDKGINVIADIVDDVTGITNGIKVAKNSKTYTYATIIADALSQISMDNVPDGIVPQKYKYVDGEFTENPNYRTPVIMV